MMSLCKESFLHLYPSRLSPQNAVCLFIKGVYLQLW
uniref:Uncharacterized protein n=1 Tax=Anguilla anguilla TaxID=7936 RepID=A0A0E9VJF4_ANGAN